MERRYRHHCIRRKSRISWAVVLLCLESILLAACSDDEPRAPQVPPGSQGDTIYTVALLQPLSRLGSTHLRQVADWLMENLQRAQADSPRRVGLRLEWYDEDLLNLDSLALELRKRKEVMAVIGPRYSTHVEIVANRLKGARKTLIAPSATSAELIRSYAGYGFFWALVESDITQCEVVLDRAIANGARRVSLLAASDLYGQTFIDWFAFQASEMGLEVGGVYDYVPQDSTSLQKRMAEALQPGSADILVCAPSNSQEVETILRTAADRPDAPALMWTDIACSPALLQLGDLAEHTVGITPCADPQSGFDIAHRVRYGGSTSYNKEAQVYDALLLVSAALVLYDSGQVSTMNEAMDEVTATTKADGTPRPSLLAWDESGLKLLLKGLRTEDGTRYDLRGASGNLDFDAEQQTNVICSVYGYWIIYEGRLVMLSHLSADGSRRTESTLAAWNWLPTIEQDFDASATFSYPDLEQRWALLVAGSDTWENYRHQADVLDVYQLLKSKGYTDDHIILIQEDNLATYPQNPYPGEVRRWDGTNLYTDVHTDYHLSDLTADDMTDILIGRKSDRLPQVIEASPRDNVLVFWCGHGIQGTWLLGERPEDEGFTAQHMEQLLEAVHNHAGYRKMLWLVETCYSASVAEPIERLGLPGVMAITSAGALEPSRADVKEDGIYLTNRYTRILTSLLRTTPNLTYREFYYDLFRYTIGSHVTVLGAGQFDNLYHAHVNEFF